MKVATENSAAGSREETPPRASSRLEWQRWASLAAFLPLVLASYRLGSLLFLPVLAIAFVLALSLIARTAGWPNRLLAFDLTLILGADMFAVYSTSMGEPTGLNFGLVLTLVLVLGTIVFAIYLKKNDASRNRSPLLRLRWHHALSFAILTLGITLVISIWAFGLSTKVTPYTWLVSSFSFWPVLVFSFACLLAGRLGWISTLVSMAILETATIWYVASTKVVVYQDHPLLWEELRSRVRDPGSWDILVEGLFSLPTLLLTLAIFGAFPILVRALGRLNRGSSRLVLLRVLTIVLVSGSLFVQQRETVSPSQAERYLLNSSAPWAAVHDRTRKPGNIDWEQAAQVRTRLEAPIWEVGRATPLDSLAGRYQGRSIVFLLMESQASTHIAGLGEGAFAHEASAPHFSRLMGEGLVFTNYFAAGFDTRSALWTVLTGLQLPMGNSAGVKRAPEVARVGRMADFKALDYRCDWLYAGSPRFDNWDLLMTGAGVRWWIDASETRDLPRDYWSSWGMPDDALYRIIRNRYVDSLEKGKPTFIGALTVSNHTPYSFPETVNGQRLAKDHVGGTTYADHAMNELVTALRGVPADDRPIIFVTSDTSYIENLRQVEPWGILALEGLRIPGLLLLPDGFLAGQPFEGIFSHEDVLDLLYMMVAPENEQGRKFLSHHRTVGFANSYQVLTRNTYFSSPDRWFEIVSNWDVRETEQPPERARVEKAWEQFQRTNALLWPATRQ